jgi:protein-disulfide isomerase
VLSPITNRLLAAILAAALGAGCGAEPPAPDPDALLADRPEFFAVALPADAPSLGAEPALVTIVTFADLQAPRARSNARALREIAGRLAGAVRLVHRANPLPRHRDAARAERMLRAAGLQGRFWELQDALLTAGDLSEAGLRRAAVAAGLDPERLARDGDDPALAEAVGRDRQAALDLGLGEAPWNFVNGRSLGPIRFVEDALPLVEEELARARSLVGAGVPPGDLYRRLVAGGRERLREPGRAARRVRDPAAVHHVPVAAGDPSRGPEDAPLTAVVFADFGCPFSARLAQALGALSAKLGDRFRLVFRHNPSPSRPGAELAAEAAVEAKDQGRFWELHDLLFASGGIPEREGLIDLGRRAGLDPQRLEAALLDRRHGARVAADRALAAAFELHDTPSLFLNGKLRQGSLSFDQLLVLARDALAEAGALPRAAADAGTAATPYEHLTAGGAAGPVWLEPGADAARSELVTDGTHRVHEIDLPADTPFLGAASAPVTVVEFGDYQCGWCARSHETLVALERRYRGRVRVAFLHFPLAGHEHARIAAEAAVEAAIQGRFWQFHARLIANRDALDPERLVEHGRAAGLDAASLAAAIADRRHRERVDADRRLGRALGIAGTPAFFVNGRKATSSRLEEELPRLVDHVLKLM